MARLRQQIYDNITAAKEANSDLDNLLPNPDNWTTLYTFDNFKLLANTVLNRLETSKVALWRLISYLISDAIWVLENLFDQFKTEVETSIGNNKYGNLIWYTNQAKAFQYGDELVWIDDSYYDYATIDEDKQIVTQANANVSNGVIRVKVAKGDIGSLEPLTAAEKTAVQVYFLGNESAIASGTGVAPTGSRIEIISDDADKLRLAIQVFYNPLVLDSSGVLIADGTTKPVNDAIENYIQTLPFDSTFRLIDLVDDIQVVEGVENVVVENCDAYYASTTPIDVTAESGQLYITNGGYMEMDTNYGLNEFYDYPTNTVRTITYIANT